MELTSAPFHKAEVFWRGFLLTVSLLTYWTSPTTAQITVEVVPPHVAEGQNILLVVHNLPARYAVINWYKGQGSLKKLIAKFVRNKSSIENGPGYTHRETIYPNGSLFINNVKMEDEELYTLHLEIDRQSSLWVNTLSLPITTKNSNPLEGEDSVALMCEPRTQNAAYLWRIHGQSLKITNRMQLSKDNNTLKIVPARRNDSGDYYCKVSNQISSKNSDPIKLEVMALPPKPSSATKNSNPMDGEDSVALMGETKTHNTAYLWRINDQSLSKEDRLKLSYDYGTLTLLNVVRTDIDDPFTLNITCKYFLPAVLIISPSNIHFHSSSNLSLSCHTDVNPPAKFFWFINGELQSSSQDRFISNININNSDPTTALSNTVTVLSKTTVKNIRVLSKWISEISVLPVLESL
uniref:Ig-like domain-containing protein n=1 Tax=Peromyscus maniculatus bairdii TaxID=230844 RepID=A0A8C8W2Y3_PERMB